MDDLKKLIARWKSALDNHIKQEIIKEINELEKEIFLVRFAIKYFEQSDHSDPSSLRRCSTDGRTILDPNIRWFPADEDLRDSIYVLT